jgi:hypothetical protein
VHNQGAALINQRHPAGEVIKGYLRKMQNQWDWMLNLSKCLEGHLRDACNAKAFVEESEHVEQQMQQQLVSLANVSTGEGMFSEKFRNSELFLKNCKY